jgi:hypothetical protein
VHSSFHSVQCFVLVWLLSAFLRLALDACTIVTSVSIAFLNRSPPSTRR